MIRLVQALIGLLLLAAMAAPTRAAADKAPPPSDSIYQLDLPLTDQDGHDTALAARRGRVQLVSMFYSSCQYACPLIIEAVKRTRHALTKDEQKQLDVLMVSFDPTRDTPERLREVFSQRKLERDRDHWTLARTDPANVRKLAALLDIQYRALDNGEFNHASALVLIDAEGRIVARSDKLGELDPAFVGAIQQLLAAK